MGGSLGKSASEIAELVASGRRTAVEFAEEALDAIERSNGILNAFLSVNRDLTLEAAGRIDAMVAAGEKVGRLAGVPVALKDNMCQIGFDTTCASKILNGWSPPYSATVVQKMTAEGAVTVGKTNLDEFAMGSSTENSAFGPTRNPIDLERVPGGSSGGSAAAVAASIVPLALGSDTGGSIRQPASLTGVVGVKPTYGVVSRYGLVAFASSLDQIGPFSRTVGDSALALEVISGWDNMDSTSYDGAKFSLVSQQGVPIDGVRIGIVKEFMDGCDEEVLAAVRAAAEQLSKAGAKVDEVSIPETKLGLSAYYIIAPAEASSNLARFDGVRFGLRVEGSDIAETNVKTRTAGFGDEVKRRIMLGTYALSSGYYDAYYGKAQQVKTMIKRGFERAYRDFDALISPVSPTTAFRFGERASNPLAMYLSDVCTIPSNLAGHPAMSVPFSADSSGLPIGIQVLAPALGEELMFRIAFSIERASGGGGFASLDPALEEVMTGGR